MKKILYLLVIGFSLLQSCSKKKDKTSDTSGLSQDIQNFVPQTVIDSMRAWGLTINEGKVPPMINGIYDLSKNYCIFDNSGNDQAETYFADYRFRFRDQDNDKLTISLDFKNTTGYGTDSASGKGSFISGNGNDFTVFTENKGISDGIHYEDISFYSGTITSTGIKNFQMGRYLKSKDPDPDHKLVDVGTSRIFEDDDGFSDKITTYRIGNNIGKSDKLFPALSAGGAQN